MAKASPRKTAQTVKTPRTSTQPGQTDFFQNVRLQSRLIFVLAFLLYANTLRHGFVLDDGLVITENTFTQSGWSGIGGILSHDTFYGYFQKEGMDTLVAGGRYRPLSLMLFAVAYQFAGANPFVYHLLAVLLFALTCVVLYRMLLRLLEAGGQNSAYRVAWLATMLFTVHPIHTEVVANIKSCDEILALLGSLAAMHFSLQFWDTGRKQWAAAAGISFFLACMAKENAAAYALLIPMGLWFFRQTAPDALEKRHVLGTSWPVFAGLVLFLLIRGSILPWNTLTGGGQPAELLNNPFLKLEGGAWVPFAFSEKLATILYTLWKYVQLLVVPYPLTHDYYPRHIDIMTLGQPMVWLGLAVYGFMVYRVVRGVRRRDATAFALLLYLLPLGIVSNLVFPIGTNMSERFAFMPSVGGCLLAGLLLARLIEKNNPWGWRLFMATALLFSVQTVARNFAWESNEKLYRTDIAVSRNSLKLQTAYANILLERARVEQNLPQRKETCQEALDLLDRSFAVYPDFSTALNIRGGIYMALDRYPEAISDFRKGLAQAPDNQGHKEALATALREAGRYYGQQQKDLANSFRYLNESWSVDPQNPETARLIGVAHMVQGNREMALEWYVRSEKVATEDAVALWDLGVAYNNMGMPDKARELQQKAYAIDPSIIEKAQGGQ